MHKFGLTKEEERLFKKLDSPRKIQDWLNALPMNFEKNGDTCRSPRVALRHGEAHCFEGALIASAILLYHGQKPMLLDLKTTPGDWDHVVALFKKFGKWGAISKTNHAVLRYREPVYRDVRELAMSYFHEYYDDKGFKTLRSFSKPFYLSKSKDWITSEDGQEDLAVELDDSPHTQILNRKMVAFMRRADEVELKATDVVEWQPDSSERP